MRQKVDEVVNEINEAKRVFESQQKIIQIQNSIHGNVKSVSLLIIRTCNLWPQQERWCEREQC